MSDHTEGDKLRKLLNDHGVFDEKTPDGQDADEGFALPPVPAPVKFTFGPPSEADIELSKELVGKIPGGQGFEPGPPIGFETGSGTSLSTVEMLPGAGRQDPGLISGFVRGAADVPGVLESEVRDFSSEVVRGAEGVISEFTDKPFQFSSTRNQLDTILLEVGFDPSKVRAKASEETRGTRFAGREIRPGETGLLERDIQVARDLLALAEDTARQPGGTGIGQFLGSLATLGQGLPEAEKREFIETLMMFASVSVMAGPAAGAAAGMASGWGTTAVRNLLAGAGRGAGKLGFGKGPAVSREGLAEAFATRSPLTRAFEAPQAVAPLRSPRSLPTGGTPEATQPARVVRSLEKAWQFRRIDRPGSILKFLESVPGIKQLIHSLRPANAIPEHVQVANVARSSARAEFSSRAFLSRQQIIRQIDGVFGPGVARGGTAGVRFVGSADDVVGIEGTMLDIAQRPRLYQLSDAQKTFLARWQGRNQDLLHSLQRNYGSTLSEFGTPPGGVFLSHADVAEDMLKATNITERQAVMTGRAKTRIFETAADRMKFDKDFVPQTDIVALQGGMDEAKSYMASLEVFKGGTGGKTLTEIIDAMHPTLRKARDDLAKKVTSLEGKIQRAEAASTKASRAAKRSEKRMVKMDQKAVLLLDTIEELGEQLGAEFPRLAQQVKNLQKRSEALQSKILDLRDVAALKGIKRNGLMPELEHAAEKLEALRRRYQAADIRPFQFVKEPVFRYYPAEEAKAIKELVSESSNRFVRLLDDIRGTAFAGDPSPITGIQLPVSALFQPVRAVQRLIGAGKNSIQSRDLLRSFRVDTLARAVEEDPQGYFDLAFFSGIPITAGTPSEFSGGLLRYIPGFTRANEAMFTVVLRQMKSVYDRQLRLLAKHNLPDDAAKAIAADMATKVIPLWNPSRLGLSPGRAAAIRSVPTSVSFLLRPATLMAEATTGLAKMAVRIALTPQEGLAVKLMLNYTASTEFLSISSAVISALIRGTDPWQAAERAANPLSPRFGDLIIGTRRLPLGGPYRGIIRMIVPREVDWAPIPVPFAGIGNFVSNRVNPGLQTQIRLVRNRDFQKGVIRKGYMPEQVLRTLLYEVEGMAPLTAGAAISGLRRELSPGDIAEEAAGQFLGTNLTRETPFQERNVVASRWAKEQRLEYKVESYYDLGRSDMDRFDAEFPEEVASIKKEQARQVRQGIPRAVAFGHLENVTTIRIDEEEGLVKELQLPPSDPRHATLDSFRQQYSRIQAKAANGRAVLDPAFDIFKDRNELPKDPNKRAMVQYYDAFDDAHITSGRLIFELLDENMAALESQWSDSQKQWVEENTGLIADHPPLIQEYLRDRDREDVKEWRLLTFTEAEERGVLGLYRTYLRIDPGAAGRKAFRDQHSGLDIALGAAQQEKDKAREASYELELILYKWGYIDTPLNFKLEREVAGLQIEQGGVVTDRQAIDREPALVAP
jgi:hypothetical protein